MNALATIEAASPPVVTYLNWRPIADIPEDRKDGRDVLLWIGRVIIASWCDVWCDAVGRPVRGAMYWADVEGPVL